jgi:hypothetical protein
MKSILFLIPLFFAFNLTAQSVILDTILITQKGNIFYQVTRTEYSDGNYREITQTIGDTSSLDFYFRKINYVESQNIIRNARSLFNINNIFSRLVENDVFMLNNYGLSPLMNTQKRHDNTFLNDVWQLSLNGVTDTVRFDTSQNGKLQIILNNNPKNIDLLQDVLRVIDYPSQGLNTFFYKIDGETWTDMQNSLLKRIGVAPPPPPVEE